MYRKSPIIFECVSKVAYKETASNQNITNPASTLRYSINQWNNKYRSSHKCFSFFLVLIYVLALVVVVVAHRNKTMHRRHRSVSAS